MSILSARSSTKDISKYINTRIRHLTVELEQISDHLMDSYPVEEKRFKFEKTSHSSHLKKILDIKLVDYDRTRNVILLIFLVSIVVIFTLWYFSRVPDTNVETAFKSRYIIENLKGDTIDTWQSWKWVKNSPMDVVIINEANLPSSKLEVIQKAITSDEIIEIDSSQLHKGPQGTFLTYYVGWEGALSELKQRETKYDPPFSFNVIVSDKEEGRIVITLTDMFDVDGYSGYTKSIVSQNEILKSHIIIYRASSLSDDQLATIIRHEFGHALGLGHSTAPEDLTGQYTECSTS